MSVRRTLANLRRYHPEDTLERIEAWAVEFLMHRGIALRGAKGLVKQAITGKLGGRPREVDYTEVHTNRLQGRKLQAEAVRLSVQPDALRKGYARWLKGGGHLRLPEMH